MNFEELKKHIQESKVDSYQETVEKAKNILVNVSKTLEGKGGYEGRLCIEDREDENHERYALCLRLNDKPIIALFYRDGKNAVDLDLDDSEASPVELSEKDAEDIRTVFEYLAEQIKKRSNYNESEPSEFEKWVKRFSSNIDSPCIKEALEDVLSRYKADIKHYSKIIENLHKTLDGDKVYENLSKYALGNTYIFTSDDKCVLIVHKLKSHYTVGDDVSQGPSGLVPAPELKGTLDELLRKAEKLENSLDPSLTSVLEHILH